MEFMVKLLRLELGLVLADTQTSERTSTNREATQRVPWETIKLYTNQAAKSLISQLEMPT